MLHTMKKQGFSLLELSIVLVIIGLIAGGIVAGAAMIRAAELRAVLTEKQQYQTAVNTFRDKYLGLPGDLRNATSFWGEMGDAAAGACPATAGTGSETCDGNGDGMIGEHTGSNEHFTFWQHLANADLIAGTMTGVNDSTQHALEGAILGENIPTSKISSAGFFATWRGAVTSHAHYFDSADGNLFHYGADAPANASVYWPLFTPQEAWNIDEKLDDGKPATGNVKAMKNTSTINPNCTTTDVNSTAEYSLTSEDVLCSVIFSRAF